MSTLTAPAKPKRRWWIVVVGCLVFAPVAAGGLYLFQLWSTDRDLDNALAETERLDPRWRFEDVLADCKNFPDETNAARQVLKAAGRLGKLRVDFGEENARFFDDLAPPVPLDARQAGLLRDALGRIPKEAIDEARDVRKFPGGGRFAVRHDPIFISTQLPDFDRCGGVMVLLEYDAMQRTHDGDLRGALESIRAILCAARAGGDEPMLICYLVRIGGNQRATGALERAMAHGVAPEDELAALQELLEKEAADDTFVTAMRGERGGLVQMVETFRKQKAPLAPLLDNGKGVTWSDRLIDVVPGITEQNLAALLRLMNRSIEAARLPLHEQDAALRQIDANAQAGPPLARTFMRPILRVAAARAASQARLRCAAAAVATERYRQRAGRWPASLDALVKAGLLKQVPADPFDGQPLRLRPLPDGLVIYAVGPDRTDNQGTLNRADPRAAGSDIGIRLWDAAERGKAPAVP